MKLGSAMHGGRASLADRGASTTSFRRRDETLNVFDHPVAASGYVQRMFRWRKILSGSGALSTVPCVSVSAPQPATNTKSHARALPLRHRGPRTDSEHRLLDETATRAPKTRHSRAVHCDLSLDPPALHTTYHHATPHTRRPPPISRAHIALSLEALRSRPASVWGSRACPGWPGRQT